MTDEPGDIALGSTRWIKLRRSGQANPFSPRLIMRRFGPIGRQRIVRARPWLPTPRLPGSRFRPRLPRLTTLGRLGTLEVRLARNGFEIRRAQQIRFQVFYQEGSASPDPHTLASKRDRDAFDRVCDHMLVLDHEGVQKGFRRRRPQVVGTYRLLRQEVAERHRGFYSKAEFDIAPLLARHRDKAFLELGRSCVLKPYRTKRTVELLWHGVWTYILRHQMDVMFGCASLDGTDPDKLANDLSFLYHNALAPPEWRVRAHQDRHVAMDRLPAESVDAKAALRNLPPLIKGYLRLGGFVGDGAVIDHQFGTTDVLIVLPREIISPRYVSYYGAEANRHAATE
jgi:putative hemolysin